MVSSFFRICVLLAVVAAAPLLRAQREKIPDDDLPIVEAKFPNAQKTGTGIRYIIQAQGTGDSPVPGDMVSLIYAGRLLDGTLFDQDINRQHPFTFRVGRNVVIEAWDQILQDMKRGERRIVIVPPELGYGMRGSPPRIPGNATLVFLIELIDFKHDK